MAGLSAKPSGPAWRQDDDWKARTLASMSPPPGRLLSFFAVAVLFLYLSHYARYTEHLRRAILTKYFLFLLAPVLLILLSRFFSPYGRRLLVCLPKPEHDSIHRAGGSPWGVGLLVVLLLLLVSYKSSSQSKWWWPSLSWKSA